MFVNERTRLLNLHLVELKETIYNKVEYITYKIIIVTDNTALYEAMFEFKKSSTKETDPLVNFIY